MTVKELIKMLEKVSDQDKIVIAENGDYIDVVEDCKDGVVAIY